MLERLHNFSMVCALILASGCVGSFVGSLTRSRDGSVPVYQVVICELPIVAYIWALASFLTPPDTRSIYSLLSILISTGSIALFRFFIYSNKYELHQRDTERSKQVVKGGTWVGTTQVRILTRDELARVQKQNRVSRYRRNPVI
jgi:anaerobic C4-dicarboxylate transporter